VNEAISHFDLCKLNVNKKNSQSTGIYLWEMAEEGFQSNKLENFCSKFHPHPSLGMHPSDPFLMNISKKKSDTKKLFKRKMFPVEF